MSCEQYDSLLEEQAYPFEEQAISIHELNAKRAPEGVYDDSVSKSFEALAKLKPARYGKIEHSETWVRDALRRRAAAAPSSAAAGTATERAAQLATIAGKQTEARSCRCSSSSCNIRASPRRRSTWGCWRAARASSPDSETALRRATDWNRAMPWHGASWA